MLTHTPVSTHRYGALSAAGFLQACEIPGATALAWCVHNLLVKYILGGTRMHRIGLIMTVLSLGAGVPCLAGDMHIPVHEKSGSTLYVSGQIEGFGPTEFLIDTGASYLAINEDMLEVLEQQGHAHFLRHLTGTMADGRRRSIPIYSISGIVIGDNCVLSDVEAAVLPGNTRNILGLSALRRAAPFTVSIDPPAISLSGCEKPQV